MTDRTFRAIALGFLASTSLSAPALAQQDTTAPPPPASGSAPQGQEMQSPAPATNATDITTPPSAAPLDRQGNEIVVTATKREELLQNVPQSVIALGTKRLDELNIKSFEDFSAQLPSVAWTVSQSGGAVIYMRGVAATSSGEGNHSGSLPSVGV